MFPTTLVCLARRDLSSILLLCILEGLGISVAALWMVYPPYFRNTLHHKGHTGDALD